LLMNLVKLGREADAALLLDRYIANADDAALQIDGLAALPLFLSSRAAIRAKGVGAMSRLIETRPTLKARALAHFDVATDNLPAGVKVAHFKTGRTLAR